MPVIRPVAIAAFMLAATAAVATAAPCVSAPAGSTAGNVQNDTAYMLCLQQQVSTQQQRQADDAHWQGELNAATQLQNLQQRLETTYQPPVIVVPQPAALD
jgi:hypothetical protein